MVIDIRKQFDLFAAYSRDYGIIEHETFDPLRMGQCVKIGDDSGKEQREELFPVKPGLVQESIIFE